MRDSPNQVQVIAIEQLAAHPDRPNVMSRDKFNKLVRHIERTGRYEPIVVRPACRVQHSASQNPQQSEHSTQYEIINGHHRVEALKKLGHSTADCLVWEMDDEQADMYLLTLNRLGGRDVLDKRIALLQQLNRRRSSRELGRLLPQTAKQIERLVQLNTMRPLGLSAEESPTGLAERSLKPAAASEQFLMPMTFFVTAGQQEIIRRAISEASNGPAKRTKAKRRADALEKIAEQFVMISLKK